MRSNARQDSYALMQPLTLVFQMIADEISRNLHSDTVNPGSNHLYPGFTVPNPVAFPCNCPSTDDIKTP